MFSNLFRQQVRLALLPRVSSTLGRHSQRVVIATTQRAFSLSRTHFQEEPHPAADAPNSSEDYQKISVEPATVTDAPPSPNVENTDTLWLGNLHFRTRAEEVYEMFASYGTVKAVHFPRNREGLRNGRAYVEFSTPEEATRAFESGEQEPFVLRERLIRIEFAKNPPKAWIENHDEIRPNNTIHISNYPHPGDDASLLALMHNFNQDILKIHFMKNVQGKATGKAFVTFRNLESAQRALISFQGHEVAGAKLLIFFAHWRSDKSPSSKSSSSRSRRPKSESTPTTFDA